MLQDSLGGNTHTIVICTISPSESAIAESFSTLQFGDRAKSVMVRVRPNEVVDDAVLLARAQHEIARLQLRVRELEAGISPAASSPHLSSPARDNRYFALEQKFAKLEEENKKLRKKLKKIEHQASTDSRAHSTSISPKSRAAVDRHRLQFEEDSDELEDFQPGALDIDGLRYQLQGTEALQQLDEEAASFEKIQNERRKLEEELSKVNANLELTDMELVAQLGKQPEPEQDKDDDEDVCPMCRRKIDDHTDAELDACIESEELSEQAALPPTAPEPEKPVVSNKYTFTMPKVPSATKLPGNQSDDVARKGEELMKMSEKVLQAAQRSKKKRRKQGSKQPSSPLDGDLQQPKAPSTGKAGAGAHRSRRSKHKSKGAKEAELCLSCTVADVGATLKVYKYRYDFWYVCVVVGYDSRRKMHFCQYEDGDKQWHDLTQKQYKLVDLPEGASCADAGGGGAKQSRHRTDSASMAMANQAYRPLSSNSAF